MLHRLLNKIIHYHHGSDFETYLSKVQSSGLSTVPTADEAKRDYQIIPWLDPYTYTHL